MFGGFRASLNIFGGGKKNKREQTELSPDMCVTGAYRSSREDSFGYNNLIDQPKKTSSEVLAQLRPTKSATNLAKPHSEIPNLRHSTPEISRDPRGAEQNTRNGSTSQNDLKTQEKEQKRLEKQRQVEEKAREKQAREERARQAKLQKEQEKKEANAAKNKKAKQRAPQPMAAQPHPSPPESSISKSSGPPPYSSTPVMVPTTSAQNIDSFSGNVMLKKPVDTGSWDMVSQHRAQVIKPTAKVGGGSKQNQPMIMDLNYNVGTTAVNNVNSEA